MNEEETFAIPEQVEELANDIVDYTGESTDAAKLNAASGRQIETMLAGHEGKAQDFHDQISQLCTELMDDSDVPASVISALEDGLRHKVDYVTEHLRRRLANSRGE